MIMGRWNQCLLQTRGRVQAANLFIHTHIHMYGNYRVIGRTLLHVFTGGIWNTQRKPTVGELRQTPNLRPVLWVLLINPCYYFFKLTSLWFPKYK